MPPGERQAASLGRVRWTVCAMLFFATSINYIDRQVIGLLKPTLSHNIGLTEQSYGYIIAGFQFAYAVGLLLAGRLVDRIGARRAYPAVMATWSLAAMAHALVSSPFGFGVARLFLGLGEAGNFPAAIKAVTEWFPPRERSLATGIFNSGANLGAIVAPATVPWIALRFGWRAAFLATGLIGLPWIVWWARSYRRPGDHPTLTGQELLHIPAEAAAGVWSSLPWMTILRHRQAWAVACGKFLTDPIWWFYLFWLPSFLDARFHLGLTRMGLPIIFVYNMSAVGSIGGGWLPVLFARFGLDVRASRLLAMLMCACLSLPMFLLPGVQSEWMAAAILGLAAAGHQGWSANMYTVTSDLFPSQAVASVTGLAGMAGSVGAILLSLIVGRVLQTTGSYTGLFYLAGSVYLVSLALIYIVSRGLRPVGFVSALRRPSL